MVTFQTVGIPLVSTHYHGDEKTMDAWITETLDPNQPYISIMANGYECEDDANPGKMATLQISEPRGREKDLLQYASVPVLTVPCTNRPKNPAVGHLLMHHHKVLTREDDPNARQWHPYQIRAFLHRYAIQYHNNMFDKTGIIQLDGGNLLVVDGDRSLQLHRYAIPGAPMLQVDLTNNSENCTAITVFEEAGSLKVRRNYVDIPNDESEVMKRIFGPRYNYRALRI